ncbi:hypothetical protein HPB48_018927 [Haemaphysalis longicornis]|uniref:Uncharacterized protein n=1 Tax=Haemaphysalis longicornis TaxID=44386 RepID=A0A9J6GTU9_HAELO|nr:hypothetical protein HPB48_018927 [Haemaphysalis longicornis]
MSRPQDRCWGIPFVAMCACFLLCMPMSSTGYLYVLFMEKYEINRETASWPESIITFSQNFGAMCLNQAKPPFHRQPKEKLLLAAVNATFSWYSLTYLLW